MGLRPGLWSYWSDGDQWYMVVKDKSYVGDGWGTFKFALRREGWDLGSDFKPVDKLMLPLELI